MRVCRRLIRAIGDTTRFPDADALWGLTVASPPPLSGEAGRLRERAPCLRRPLPATLCLLWTVLVCIQYDLHVAVHYRAKARSGMPKKKAVIAVARKPIRIVHALLKSQNTCVPQASPNEVPDASFRGREDPIFLRSCLASDSKSFQLAAIYEPSADTFRDALLQSETMRDRILTTTPLDKPCGLRRRQAVADLSLPLESAQIPRYMRDAQSPKTSGHSAPPRILSRPYREYPESA